MESSTFVLSILVLAAIAGYVVYSAYRYTSTWYRMRGARLVICPETHEPQEVRIDALAAAKWAAISGEPAVQLRHCSRWPERRDCDQDCLYQVIESEHNCRVTAILNDWYRGKSCAFCGTWFEEIQWHDNKPAFLRKADHRLLQWDEVSTRDLPEVFNESSPVCSNCYFAESFRAEHPEMVTDRPETPMYHG